MNTVRTIVLAVVVGAVATWLLTGRGAGSLTDTSARSSADSRAESASIGAKTRAPSAISGSSPSAPAIPGGEGASQVAGPTIAPSSVAAPAVAARNDATYGKMLASAASYPRSADWTRRITEIHDRFLQAPDDDPDWARRTEQALREFFRSRSAGNLVTSISCRSAFCEVQGEFQRRYPDDQTAKEAFADPAEDEHEAKSPVAALREEWPLGQSLKVEAQVSWHAGDGVGVIQLYRRMEARAAP
jgi:hypothetical protein